MSTNPITVEVVRNAINAYADEMGTALCRSAYNMMIYEVRDYCCGLIDTQARMISQNKGGLPIFLADLGIAVRDGIERIGLDGFAPGDVVIMNHGGVCGQHLNNMVIYAPCFHDGKLVAFAANRAHWVDVGGMRVGFGSNATTEIFQEGLQFRSLKIYEAGKRNETLWQVIQDNVRFPDSSLGDLRAQVASAQIGTRRFAELVARYGFETVQTCIETIWENAEREARAFVERIPDGVYEAESFLDNDGLRLDVPLRIKVKVVVEGDRMIIDFSDVNEQVPGSLNSGYSGGLASARIAFKNLTQPTAPVNEGVFRALELILPEGKLLNARPPAALGQWSIPMPTVIDTILRALAPALPDRIPAGHVGVMSGYSFAGFRAAGHRRFLLMNICGGGWGGRPSEDGEDASVSVCQGDVRNAPVELQELQYPFVIERFALRTDSGGAGKHRGGLGTEIAYRCLQKCDVNINSERTIDPPWGLWHGKPGATAMAVVERAGGRTERILKATALPLEAGDRVTFFTGGGGGWGDPRQRDPAAIAEDVRKGFVSPEAAHGDYGFEAKRPLVTA
jgi:N-methylhydantoinase B